MLPSADAVRAALREARRVLEPGGRIVIVSLCEATGWRIDDYHGTCLHMTPGRMADQLRGAGFQVLSVERCVVTTAVFEDQGYEGILFAVGQVAAS